jgi:hypothetical protein
MSILSRIARTNFRLVRWMVTEPKLMGNALKTIEPCVRGMCFAAAARSIEKLSTDGISDGPNPLLDYFEANREGPGIFKWVHYFEIYHRHLKKFIGTDVHVMEIGIYSGGSLPMWRQYFGEKCQVFGVDIEAVCKVYEADRIKILIGDQGDRTFWASVRKTVPRLDVIIDDGGHHPEQQIASLEEMLPHLVPGGIYICEDTTGVPNYFTSYVSGIANQMNGMRPSRFESAIDSIHIYPGVSVIEKRQTERVISSERRGTQWQPFRFE